MPRKKSQSVVEFVYERQTSKDMLLRRRFVSDRIAQRKTLYKKNLVGQFGCVNAIEFSNNGGDYLASGGDDRRVLLWNMEQAMSGGDKKAFVSMKGEHHSNIFSVAFDSNNTKIYSGGNDDQVLVHDMHTGDTRDVFLHEDAVYGLAVDPRDDNIYASACADGRVLLWDTRLPSHQEPFVLGNYTTAFHAVVYHPMEPCLLATANSKEGVSLWDVRSPRSCLMRYGSSHTQQNAMSVRFNQTGTQLVALRRRLPPVVYNIQSSGAAVQFDHPGYYNSCTMKSCCFAGDKDQYIISGSDDFNLYMWRVPEPGDEKAWVDRAQIVLSGHRSIVNQVRYNPHTSLVASSGVEKVVKIWSPFCAPGMTEIDDQPRKMFSHQQYINLVINTAGTGLAHDYTTQSTDEDPRMIAFFDSLVQREVDRSFSDSDDSELSPDTLYLNFEAVESESSHESQSESSISSFQASLIRRSEIVPDDEESGNSDSNMLFFSRGKKRKEEDDSSDASDDKSDKRPKDIENRAGPSAGSHLNPRKKAVSSATKRKQDSQSKHSSSEESSSSDDEIGDFRGSRLKNRIMRRFASRHKKLKENPDNLGEANSHRFRRMQSQLDHDRMINLRQRWAYCKALKARIAKSHEEPRPVTRVENEDNLDIIAEHLDKTASREQRTAISRLRKRVLHEEGIQNSNRSLNANHVTSVNVCLNRLQDNTEASEQIINPIVQDLAESSAGSLGETSQQQSVIVSPGSENSVQCNLSHCRGAGTIGHMSCNNTSTVDNTDKFSQGSASNATNNVTTASGSGQDAQSVTENCHKFSKFKRRLTSSERKRIYRSNSKTDESRRAEDSDSE